MNSSTLSDLDKQNAYKVFLLPKIRYPLPCTLLTKKELTQIHRPALTVVLKALGLNNIFPLAIIHDDMRYYGLEVESLYELQGITQIQYYIGHVRIQQTTGKLMLIEKDYVELIIGYGQCPLHNPSLSSLKWIPRSWITNLAMFIQQSDGKIQTQSPRVLVN